MSGTETFREVREALGDALGIGAVVERYGADTRLLGEIPEFDSMAVVSVVTTIEERFGIEVHDDELDAQTFETLGALVRFVESKLGE